MTILFLTTVLPAEASTGGESASRAFVESLRAAGNRVIVIGYRRHGSATKLGPDDRDAGARHIETQAAGPTLLVWLSTAIALRLPYSVAKYRSRGYRRAVSDALAGEAPSLLIVDHAQAAGNLPRGGLNVPLVYLAHNVEHHLYEEATGSGSPLLRWLNRREARRISAVESRLASVAREVWALTAADGRDLEDIASGPVRVFALPPTTQPPGPAEPRHDVVMLGTWTWKANEAGLRWFCDEVHPLLPAGTRVAIAGRGAEAVAGERRGVVCTGFVDDPQTFLAQGRVVVVPARAGSGVQVKTLDAIAAGRPTVATPIALRGIDSPPGTVHVADEPEEMASAIERLLGGPDTTEPDPEAVRWVGTRHADFNAAVAEAAR